ncbi:MAG: D-2-hydroxyacid dehydrogenase [Granulicella sp.]
MKIVVLDAYTINPGDMDWAPIRAFGECTFYDRSSQEEIPGRIRDADVVLTNKAKLDQSAIAAATHLRYIGVMATGYNIIDLEAAEARGIVVTNVPSYSTASTAQGTIALLLELTNHVGLHSKSVHEGGWSKSPDFSYWEKPIIELAGLVLGVVGWGQIGRAVAKTASALGMSIIVTSRSQRTQPSDPEMRFVQLPDIFTQADVITLHCPLTEDTKDLINARTLATMKKSALLLNTARGGLIAEQDLSDALNNGVITGAALDVLSTEPPDPSNPLLTARNCIITPHNHWASSSARRRMIELLAANMRAYLSGNPVNVVSKSRVS